MQSSIQQQKINIDPLDQYYDFQDSELLKIKITESSLPFSGQGLFATKLIDQHEIIAEYYGSIMRTKNCMDQEFSHQDKMVQIDEQYCVISRGPASRANDIVRWQPQNYNSSLFQLLKRKKMFPTHSNCAHNAKINIESKQKAFLKATRPIKAGEEIFIEYGFEYWDFFYKEHISKEERAQP